jgi:hypothetical protein
MVRDNNAPKRPLSGFFRFAQTVRAEVNAQGFVGKDAGVKIGQMWKDVDAETKAEYQKQFQEEMVEFKELYAAYKLTDSYKEFQDKKKALKQKKAKRKIKDPNRPKRAPSAYFLFMKDARPQVKGEMQDASITEIGKKMGEMWRNLDEEQKAVYVERAAELKKEADEKIAAYKSSDDFKAHQEKVKQVTPKQKVVAKKKK